MSEGNVGIRSVLKFPSIYDLYQWAVGVRVARDRVFERYVPIPENCALLDVGCGSGELLDYLPQGVRYTGVDINPAYIEAAKKKYAGRGEFMRMDVNDIGKHAISANAYDIVILFGLLHHLDDGEVRKLLAAVRGALKPSGFVFSVDGVYLPGQSWLKRFILSKDRGMYVRAKGEYEALARDIFPKVESFVERNPLRFGFLTDYLVMRLAG